MQSIITAIIRATPATEPKTIPVIAPPDNDDEELSDLSSSQLQRYLLSQAYVSYASPYSKSIIVISLFFSLSQLSGQKT